MKKLISVLIFFAFILHAQTGDKIDSLNIILTAAQNNKNWQSEVEISYALGTLYFDDKEFGKAMPYFLVVDSIAKAHELLNDTIILATLYRSEILRQTFTYQGVEDAHQLQKEALQMAEQIGSEKLIYEIYLRLVDMNGLVGDYEKMKYYLDKVYPYYLKSGNPAYLARVYMNYMNYYYYIKDFDRGGEKLKEGIAILRTTNDSLRLARLIGMYGAFFNERKGDCKKAIEQFKEAEEIYHRINYDLSDSYMYLMEEIAKCSEETGDYQNAAMYYKRAYEIKKELVNKANNELTRKLETQYQSKEKQHEIELLKSQNELAIQQTKNQRNLFMGGIGLTTFAGLFFFFLYKNRQKTNRKLKELDQAKSHFFANISHEFRTPLTLIQSPVDEELEKDNLERTQRDKYNLIKRHSERLLKLVDQLLMLSKIEANALKLRVKETDLDLLIHAVVSSFSYGFQKKGIHLDSKIDINIKGFIDIDVFEKIATNLISNSLKYTAENGLVKLNISTKDGIMIFRISNTGNMLNREDIQNIFNRFYQVDSTQQGFGIGLTLVKELTELHHGDIRAFYDEEMLVFEVKIPVGIDAYNSNEILSHLNQEPGSHNVGGKIPDDYTDEIQAESSSATKPIMLIAEDNDDMRNFIKSLFSDSYKVIVATNGVEALQEATDHIPDIIISDIMMPELDGLELTGTLKDDLRTSHIPIVMLTARADDQDKLQGLETGADDFIIKPFKSRILEAKVKSLLDNRAKLREYYNHEVVLKPAIFSYNKTEEKFFIKLQDVIDEKLQDPDFNADSFSRYIGMNRMQLHRKLKSMLGVSASEFIRNERLKAAKILLQDENLTISEVAYMSGFNDANYFSKSFKNLFKITPKNFREFPS